MPADIPGEVGHAAEQVAEGAARVASIPARAHERHFSPARVYRNHLGTDPRRERLFLASCGFLAGFGVARVITHAIHRQIGPFRDLHRGDLHIHHLVFGIGGLIGVGYAWLWQVGVDHGKHPRTSRSTSVLYGVAAALTLDEFALWLNLKDVYWAREGRASVDAAVGFLGVLSLGFWGAPFFHALTRELHKLRP